MTKYLFQLKLVRERGILMDRSDNRTIRAEIARQTLEIIDKKGYYNHEGQWVDLTSEITDCIESTELFSPKELERIESEISPLVIGQDKITDSKQNYINYDRADNLQVTNESTLAAAKRLWEQGYSPLCLNFASAKNPGGGFLKGSGAQEESLARASALYASISHQKKYYQVNKEFGSALYTDYMIYSPKVPVFRDDKDQLMDKPFSTAFITAPAVNASAIYKEELENRGKIEKTMINRIKKILCLAADRDHDAVVLGAYGCGVFKNSPQDEVEYFHDCLWGDFPLGRLFDQIVFAVLARKDKTTYNIFKDNLQDRSE